MSAATSPGTGLAYGLQRVCAAWGFARSSFYAMKSRQQASAERAPAKRRGPKPAVSDQALLVAIEADLEASPWEGEGHRKVWARLRVCRGHPCFPQAGAPGDAREQPALAPSRAAAVAEIPMTVRSSPMPPTSCGARTAFGCSRWTTAGVGYSPPSSIGTPSASAGMCASEATRFAALQPISMGLARLYDSTSAGAARGLALRMDHGSQYLSDHFTNQIKFWGIQPSYAFVAEPQTNGVAERFNRTLKEQIVHGRIYRNIEELRKRRPRLRRTVQCPVARREERLPEPRSGPSGVGPPRCHSGPPHETNLCPRNRVRYKRMWTPPFGASKTLTTRGMRSGTVVCPAYNAAFMRRGPFMRRQTVK